MGVGGQKKTGETKQHENRGLKSMVPSRERIEGREVGLRDFPGGVFPEEFGGEC